MSAAFDLFRMHLRATAGIVVDADKDYLIESRLRPIARAHGMSSAEALLQAFQLHGKTDLGREIVEAMTTNETYFFRDRTPFHLFRDYVLPQLLAARARERHIRIWCAGCSTGQEPYSLAMILDEEARRLAGWRIEIVATDLSAAVLDLAREGVYNQFEVQRGLPVALLLRYFQPEGDRWRICERLRSRIRFQRFNLLEDFRSLGSFDVILCRNVLIYFAPSTRTDVLRRLRSAIRPDGFLSLGAAETIVSLDAPWRAHPEHPVLVVPGPVEKPARAALELVPNF